MKKPATLIAVPFDADNLSKVEYLQHKGDPHPSSFKKGDIISIDQWWKENESKEKYWKQWWQPINLWLISEEKLDERNLPPALATMPHKGATHKTIAVPEHFPLDTKKYNTIIKNDGKCSVDWEENQCDGCKARIPIERGYIHKKPNDPTDPFGIGCTAHLYDIPKLTDGKITLHL